MTSSTSTAPEFERLLQNELPFSPQVPTAKGLLAPMLRAYGHIVFVLGILSNNPHNDNLHLTNEEIQNEVNHAEEHLDPSLIFTNSGLSATAQVFWKSFCDITRAAKTNFPEWTANERVECLTELSNRIAGFAAFLDREFTGIPPEQSDPGESL